MFTQQADAKHEILTHFLGDIRYVILRAEVQSGKTGAYHGVGRDMMARNMIERVYIVCGSHETELRSQCLEDCKEHHMPENQSKISVIFRQDFRKQTMNTRRALIVVDETHLVSMKDQTLYHFLKKHGLSMCGTSPQMIENETYILSVSATPHAEESAMIHGHSLKKMCVVMNPGPEYYGPLKYIENNKLRATYPLHAPVGKYNFSRLLDNIESQGPSYLLFRVSRNNKQYDHLCARLAEWRAKGHALHIVEYDSDKTDKDRQIVLTQKEQQMHEARWKVRIPCLETEPEAMTVVLLKGRLRCGKRVPKQYVSLAWEMSKNANTDTIIQSLLGRLSGYDVINIPGKDAPLIFLPPRLLEKHPSSAIPCSDLERYVHGYDINVDPSDSLDQKLLVIPRYASHIIPSKEVKQSVHKGLKRFPCVPIRFVLPACVVRGDRTNASDQSVKQHALSELRAHMEWIKESNILTTEQKYEIRHTLAQVSLDGIHIRHYQGTSNQNMHLAHTIAVETQTASSEHIAEFPFLTFCVVYGDFKPMEECRVPPIEGEVYAVFYTNAEGLFRAIHRNYRISLHNGATHFSIQDDSVLNRCFAGSIYGFSTDIFANPVAFFQQFDHFICIAKSGNCLFGQTFSSLIDNGAIRLSRVAYGNRLEHLKEICALLEKKHSVTISFEEKRYRPVLTSSGLHAVDHGLRYIKWTPCSV